MNDDPTTADHPSPDATPAPIDGECEEPPRNPANSDAANTDELPVGSSVKSAEPSATKNDSPPEPSCETEDSEVPEETEGEPTKLDPRWIRLERTVSLVTVVVLCAVAAAGGIGLFSATSAPWNLLILAAWISLSIAGIAAAVIYPRLSYQHWSYQLGDRVIQLRYGIIWRATVAIPLSRLQHVDLHHGPIERRFGLSTVELHTAGTQAASHKIPGLSQDTATELRDQLIDAANRGAYVITRD